MWKQDRTAVKREVVPSASVAARTEHLWENRNEGAELGNHDETVGLRFPED